MSSAETSSSNNTTAPIDTIIVVDVQKGFLTNSAAKELPQKIKDFLDANSFTHKIFTRFINPGPSGPYEQILDWSRLSGGEEIEIAEELEDYPTLTIDKNAYTPFMENTLGDFLNDNNIRQALVCGIDTDACVLQTAIGLFERNIHPIVLSDLCVNHVDQKYHDAALLILGYLIGEENVRESNSAV